MNSCASPCRRPGHRRFIGSSPTSRSLPAAAGLAMPSMATARPLASNSANSASSRSPTLSRPTNRRTNICRNSPLIRPPPSSGICSALIPPSGMPPTSFQNRRVFDFRLNPTELAVFQTNGFVVSQRLERRSFADVYYDLYTDDLPVFVTADSVLQAWHRSFVTMLAEIEDTCFRPTLSTLLTSMAAQVTSLSGRAAGTALANGVLDADFFLAVARSLVNKTTEPGSLWSIRAHQRRAGRHQHRHLPLHSTFTANHG